MHQESIKTLELCLRFAADRVKIILLLKPSRLTIASFLTSPSRPYLTARRHQSKATPLELASLGLDREKFLLGHQDHQRLLPLSFASTILISIIPTRCHTVLTGLP